MNRYLFLWLLCLGCLGCKGEQTTEKSTVVITGNPVDFTYAAQKSINAVVHIRTQMQQKSSMWDYFFTDPFFNFFGQPQSRIYQAYGSGVIISEDGYIVTNNHVVEGAIKILVTLNDKREFEANLVGTDSKNDLALLQISAKNLSPIQYGNSDDVKIGEWVLAVGNPYNLTSTVTAGIVSAKARNLNLQSGNARISSFIQTDAAVNSGNSGGALVSVSGELIGINTAIASNTGSYAGYSFAIPVNIVKKVVNDLKHYGRVQHVYMGLSYADIDAQKAQELKMSDPKGLLVTKVEKGKAGEAAGILEGDVLLTINKQEVNSSSELKEILEQHLPGDVISCIIIRKGKKEEIKLTLQNIMGTTDVITRDNKIVLTKLGADLEPISDNIKSRYGVNHGLRVVHLKDGALKKSGIKENFVITSINNISVSSLDDIDHILSEREGSVTVEGFYPNGMVYRYGVLI